MNTQVALLCTLRLLLLPHIDLMLVINEVNDGGPGVPVVNVVSESGGVDNGELDFEGLLLQFGFDDIHLRNASKQRDESSMHQPND